MARAEENLAKFIRNHRKELGLSQRQLGERLGYKMGNFITLIENGRAPFPVSRWLDYAQALEVQPVKLLRLVITAHFPEMLEFIEFREVKNEETGE